MKRREGIDTIALGVLNNMMGSIHDEMALTLNRAAYSPLPRDLHDYGAALLSLDGEAYGGGFALTIHAGTLPSFVQQVNKVWGGRLYPGDIIMSNDPYEGLQHLPDISLLRPIFIDGELVAYAGAVSHQLDVGGRIPGSCACDNTDIYQEGLRIPTLKYYERGERSYTLYRLIQANTRISHMVLGDIEALVACTAIGERELIALAGKYGGWSNLRRHLDQLLDYTEGLTRAFIKELPDGVYEFEDFMDDDGFSDEPIRFCTKITVKGDEIIVDLTGTSPTVKGSINCPLATTIGMTYLVMRCLLSRDIPDNGGAIRPIKLIAPYDTVVNVGWPRGVAGRGATIGRLGDAIMGALAKLRPDLIPACSTFLDFGICMSGMDLEGKPWVFGDFLTGSQGGRPWADGQDACPPMYFNYSNINSETIEADYPVLIDQYGFVPDTGGPGKYRGGMMYVRDYRILTDDTLVQWRQDRAKFPAWGLHGGKPGALARGYHISEGRKRPLKKEIFIAKKGDLLRAMEPGCGGWGDPFERDVENVLEDVRNEKISIGGAKRDYGVVIDENTLEVNPEETKRLREAVRKSSPA